MTKPFDVFLSHAHADAEWVKVLGSYHNMGVLAQQLGSSDGALEWYRKSLAIRKELGVRAGIAASYGQLSVFFTELGKPEVGLPYGIRCLLLAVELQSPNTPIVLRTLTRIRELLGEVRFRQHVSQLLDADGAARVVDLLDRFTAEGSDG